MTDVGGLGPARAASLGGPAGLFTSAARVRAVGAANLTRLASLTHVSYQPVGPTSLPDFYMPYPCRLNPHLEAARVNLVTWSHQVGMLHPAPGVPRGAAWNEEDLRAFDYALGAAGINPGAQPAELDLVSAWLCWGTYGDDYYPAVFGAGRDMAGARAQNRRLMTFMPVGSPIVQVPLNPLEAGLADLWTRTAPALAASHQRQLRDGVAAMLDSWLWELADKIINRIPDPVDYLEMRPQTFGSTLTMSLARITHGLQVPPEVYASQTIQSLEHSAMDYACLLNDVFSYQKEMEFEGEVHNSVLAVRHV